VSGGLLSRSVFRLCREKLQVIHLEDGNLALELVPLSKDEMEIALKNEKALEDEY
jgi:hypothetical protein